MALFVLTFDYWKQYLKCIGCLALSFAVFLGCPGWCIRARWRRWPSWIGSIPRLVVLAPKYESGQVLQPGTPPTRTWTRPASRRSTCAPNHGRAAQPVQTETHSGLGPGQNLDGIRTDGKTEYTYYDMWMKTGLIGLALFLLVFFTHAGAYGLTGSAGCAAARPRRAHRVPLDQPVGLAAVWVAAYISVAATSYVKPVLDLAAGHRRAADDRRVGGLCLKASKGRWLLLK